MHNNQRNNKNFLIWWWFFLLSSGHLPITRSQYDPVCPEGLSGYVSGPGCKTYFICTAGQLASPINQCQQGLLFNEQLSVCDFETNVQCTTTPLPTLRPTKKPTTAPTARLEPTTPSPTFPPQTRSPSANVGIENTLHSCRHDIDNKLLLYQTAWNDWLPSTQYRYDGFIRGLQIMYLEGVNDMSFYLGEDVSGEEGTKIGLVNIAAFLAQSMKETIKYDSCDENNWDVIDGKYPLSNACGQLEQSYQDYTCGSGSEHFQCEVDPDMEMVATTHATWYGAPGPLFCGPKSKYPFTGFWDYTYECDFPWKDPPEYCGDYPGQKGGRYDNSEPVLNRGNRTDVEGCCWWGRGVIQTTGICNFGMLNYFLGKRAADEGRASRYATIDFCKDPSAICNRSEHPELKWIAGMFYWISSLQTYDNGWNYLDNLKEFVRGGMQDEAFIDAVSGIVNRGCHNPPCGTGSLDGGEERKENFKKVLEVFFEPDGSPRVQTPSGMPSFFNATDHEQIMDTSQPQSQPTTFGYNGTEDDEEDWSQLGGDNTLSNGTEDDEEDWSQLGGDNTLSNGTEDDEEDWSQLGGDNTLNLWCGATISEASDNCGRTGYNCPEGICPTNDLKCFMVGDSCDNEKKDDVPSTPSPSLRPTPTHKPSVTADKSEAEVKAQNYCARQKADLKTGCFTAQTCNGDDDPPCPVGSYCWGNIVCTETNETAKPSTRPSKQQSQSPIAVAVVDGVCATNYPELQKTCWNATKCSNINLCADGQKCFENIDCNFVSPKVPSSTSENPTPLPTSRSSSSSSGGGETMNSVELYCAVSESELERSCSSAASCLDQPCPLGLLCIPFNCEKKGDVSSPSPSSSSEAGTYDPTSSIKGDSHELCPDFFVGWHTRADCKEYFECSNGQIGPLYTCGEGLKFDKERGICNAESDVNQYCYGIDEAAIDDNSNKEADSPAKWTCIKGYTGWAAKLGCRQYSWCNDGHEETSHDCGENQLFDLELERCNFSRDVDCPYEASTTKSTPSPSPKFVSESDGLAEFDGLPTPTTSSSTSTKNIPKPPWLNDVRVTSNDGIASAVPVHLVCWINLSLYLLAPLF